MGRVTRLPPAWKWRNSILPTCCCCRPNEEESENLFNNTLQHSPAPWAIPNTKCKPICQTGSIGRFTVKSVSCILVEYWVRVLKVLVGRKWKVFPGICFPNTTCSTLAYNSTLLSPLYIDWSPKEAIDDEEEHNNVDDQEEQNDDQEGEEDNGFEWKEGRLWSQMPPRGSINRPTTQWRADQCSTVQLSTHSAIKYTQFSVLYQQYVYIIIISLTQ